MRFFWLDLISGIGAVLLNVLLTKMATDWFVGRELGTALALLVSSWPIGIGAALIVLPRVATTSSVATAFAMTAVAAALGLALIALIYRDPPTLGDTPPPARGLGSGLSLEELGLVSLAGSIWALFNVGYIILISFAPALLISKGLSIKGAGVATSVASWTIIPTIAFGGMLLDRIGHATALMMTSFSVLGLILMLLPTASSWVLIGFTGAVAGVPWAQCCSSGRNSPPPRIVVQGWASFLPGIMSEWRCYPQRRDFSAISQAILGCP